MSTELAWAAGFFDGEGTTSIQRTGAHLYPTLSLSQNDERPLRRFVEAVGQGRIYGPYKGRPKIHHWRVTGAKVEPILDLLWPYLSDPKREQVERVRKEVAAKK